MRLDHVYETGCDTMREPIKMSGDDYSTAFKYFESTGIPSAHAPFGYYGAKQRLARRIIQSLPPHNAWVEAFCGSAAITFAKPAAPIEVINDLNGDIINLFQQLRNNPEALCRAVSLTPYARAEFLNARVSQGIEDPLEKARLFLVSAMMTVNGTVCKNQSGFSYSQSYSRGGYEARVSRWYRLPERLMRVVERLRHVRIENRDARELIQMFSDRPATLVYLDPPYFVSRNYKYVIDADDASFHQELLDICCRAKCMLLISNYDNPLYRKILTHKNGWESLEIQAKTRDTTGKDYARTEILWMNSLFQRSKRTGKVPIRLSRKEILNNKINPSRKTQSK